MHKMRVCSELWRLWVQQLLQWRTQYIEEKIRPILLPRAQALIEHHRQLGDTLVIITATNRFITQPIAALYGVDHLLATEPELRDGRYTGDVSGTPCFQDGKVTVLEAWLNTHDESHGFDARRGRGQGRRSGELRPGPPENCVGPGVRLNRPPLLQP